MRIPQFLDDNGTIGFLAPSFGCAIEPYMSAFRASLKKWENMGYKVKLGPNCFLNEGIGISNLPKECGKEVNDMFSDYMSDVLISCGGGELMCEILDYVDFSKIAAIPPKWFMGYSDNTNLTFLLPTLCDTAAIYGPCAASFGMDIWHEAIKNSYELLSGKINSVKSYDKWERESLKDEENPFVSYNLTEDRIHKIFYKGEFIEEPGKYDLNFELRGRLLGGCLDCLTNLVGTKYDKVRAFADKYEDDGIIWFLEACDLNVFSIRRAMWHLDHGGWFKNVKGFLIGRPANGEGFMGLDCYRAVTDIVSKYNMPIIMDMDIGHKSPMMPLVVGSLATVKNSGNDVEISMDLV